MTSENPHTVKWHQNTERNRTIIKEAKQVPCVDCGGRFPTVCMDFDHIHEKKQDQRFNVSRMMTASVERLRAEIAKCDIVCSNCHQIRTEKRRNPSVKRIIKRGSV